MTIELAAVEPVSKPGRFGGTPLQQFARAGLALSIVDFRKMCQELCSAVDLAQRDSQSDAQLAGALADVLVEWMTQTSDT